MKRSELKQIIKQVIEESKLIKESKNLLETYRFSCEFGRSPRYVEKYIKKWPNLKVIEHKPDGTTVWKGPLGESYEVIMGWEDGDSDYSPQNPNYKPLDPNDEYDAERIEQAEELFEDYFVEKVKIK